MGNKLKSILPAVQSVSPIGAAVIFAVAWLAGLSGSFAVLAVSLAFFVGLHFSKRPADIANDNLTVPIQRVELQREPTPFEQLHAAGLECSKVEFKKPPQPRKQPAA